MKPNLSVCTNLFFPESRKRIEEFAKTAAFIAEKGARQMEFYHDGDGSDRFGYILGDNALSGVLIAVIPLKERLLHLCALDGDNRAKAVALCGELLRAAAGSGVGTMMVNSGKFEPGREDMHMEALVRSLETLYNETVRLNLPVQIELEPCDSGIDARQFIGPYQRASSLAGALKARGVAFSLTMDSAHTAEESQDFYEALAAVKPYCAHIHFANCCLADPTDPLYGDKHLGYEFPDTPFGFDALNALAVKLDALYPGDEALTIGLEVLCRENDPYAYFENTLERLPFLKRAEE